MTKVDSQERITETKKEREREKEIVEKKPANTVKAYLAGLIDGEGCISIARRKRKERSRRNNWYYEPVVVISNTDKRIMDYVSGIYTSGCIFVKRWKEKKHRNRKPENSWRISGKGMRELLKDIEPYLILKRTQAQLVLNFPIFRPAGRGKYRSEEMLRAQEDTYYRMKKLNRKGTR